MRGKISIFGGPDDKWMENDTGLALYEAAEADKRPDIFLPAPANDPKQPTWKRLKTSFPYIALRYTDLYRDVDRKDLQRTPFVVRNPKTNQWVVAFLVDYGPHERTGRLVDVSPAIASILRLETDDEVDVFRVGYDQF